MTPPRSVPRAVAGALSMALILASPGLPAFQAASAAFEAPGAAGLPAGASWGGYVQALATPSGRFNGRVVRDVALGPLLEDLASVDLRSVSGLGQAELAFEALARLREDASEDEVLDALAAAAQQARAQAATLAERSPTALSNEELAGFASDLAAAKRSSLLLTRVQRQALGQASGSAKAEAARRGIALATANWDARPDGDAVARGRESRTASGSTPLLAKPPAGDDRPASSAAPRSVRARLLAWTAPPLRHPAFVGTMKWGAAAAIGLPILAAAAIGLAHIGSLSLLAVSGSLIGSLLLHESAHLWMLKRLGEPTAVENGQSINPLKQVHPWGTIAVPVITLALSSLLLSYPVMIGWAKPVKVDFNKLRDPKRDPWRVARAGIAVNAALALLSFTALVALPALGWITAGGAATFVLASVAKTNLVLTAFNLIPFGHLDGAKWFVRYMPDWAYTRWLRNPAIPRPYQNIFNRLWEGPGLALHAFGIRDQRSFGRVALILSLGLLVGLYCVAYALLGMPLPIIALACSYDYYCIREKIQNEAAVKSLMGILHGFAIEIAKAAEEGEFESEINTEKIEMGALVPALEDAIDKVLDSEGFDALNDQQKWDRIEGALKDALPEALHRGGMSADEPAKIRAWLEESARGRKFLEQIKGWVRDYEVFAKWRSPKRKDSGVGQSAKKDRVVQGGKAAAVIAATLLGGHFMGLGAHAPGLAALAGVLMIGSVQRVAEPPRQPTFEEALEQADLKLQPKQKDFLRLHLTEMKLEKKAPIVGRSQETGEVYKSVTGPRGDITSVTLVGKAGVGKTTVVERIAQMLELSDSQGSTAFALGKMRGRHLLRLNLPRLLSSKEPAADLDELLGLLQRFNDAEKRSGNKIVLFIDEIHQLFHHPQGALMANLLKEPLRDGSVSFILATTEKEYKEFMDGDDAFKRRAPPIFLAEATVPETMRGLQGARAFLESLYGVEFAPRALQAAAEFSKYDQELFLPGRAFQYLRLAATEAGFDSRRDRLTMEIVDAISDLQYTLGRLSEELGKTSLVTEGIKQDEPMTIDLYNAAVDLSRKLVDLYRRRAAVPMEGRPIVDEELVKQEISAKTGVAAGQLALGREPMERYLDMERVIGERVIGQTQAVRTIAEAVRRNKAGLSNPKLPMGAFYLTGPTGSGKTHLAKELARFLFNDPEAVVRVDMSEYMESHSVAKFIGSPPGYVGYGEGGQLTEKVRRKPYSVILFDEIEKAHPDVWDLMLQILGDGRLTDGQGRTVDFKNTLILMTSNLGMEALDLDPWIERYEEVKGRLDAARASNDAAALAKTEAELGALSEEMSRQTKAATIAITQEAFRRRYRPEFEGRLSAPPLVFDRITPEMAEKIVALDLKDLANVLAYAGHDLAPPTSGVVRFLAEKGYDVRLGARPLQGAIDRLVGQPMARRLLESAQANGDRLQPSRIALSLKSGELQVEVSPLPARVVAKKDAGEGPEHDVFAQALTAAMRAVGQTPQIALETVDGWVRQALGPAGVGNASPEISNSPTHDAAPRQEDARDAAPFFVIGTAPALGSSLKRFSTTHYNPELKDPAVRLVSRELAQALDRLGYSTRAREALTRAIEDPADPFIGALKLLVEQAKSMTPADRRVTPVEVAFSIDETAARLIVHRNGPLSDKELAVLRAHFAGATPADAAAARDKAEALNVMGKDGRRLLFDLHRMLATLPGARVGVATRSDAQGGAGTDYWIEIPKATPAADADRGPASAQASLAVAQSQGLVVQAQNAPINDGAGFAHLEIDQREFADRGLKSSIRDISRQMGGQRYSREARVAAIGFTRLAVEIVKEGARRVQHEEDVSVMLRWDVNDFKTLIIADSTADQLSAEAVERLRAAIAARYGEFAAASAKISYGWGATGYGRSGSSIWIELPRVTARGSPGTASTGPATRGAAKPAPGAAGPGGAASKIREFLDGLLAQGDQRGTTLRYSAADLRAQLATPDDLEKARQMITWAYVSGKFAEIASAAQTIARLGSRAEDEDKFLRAFGNVADESGHEIVPLRRRLTSAYAQLLERDPALDLGQVQRQLLELERGISTRDARADALYAVLARRAGPEVRQILLERWEDRRIPELHAYLRRVDQAYLRALYRDWRAAHAPGASDSRRAPPSGAARLLTLLAVADYGADDDLIHFYRAMGDQWGGALDTGQLPLAARAFGRFVARLGLYAGQLNSELGLWSELSMTNSRDTRNWSKTLAAVETMGEAGGLDDLAALERIMRADPADITNQHEIVQAAAAEAWARLAFRCAALPRLLTQAEPSSAGQPPAPKLLQMLGDRHGVINRAAIEALRLHFAQPRPPQPEPPRPPVDPAAISAPEAHPFLVDGPDDAPRRDGSRFTRGDERGSDDAGAWMSRLPPDRLDLAHRWSVVFEQILGSLLGVGVDRDLFAIPPGDGPAIIWTVRQAAQRAWSPEPVAKLRQLVLLLLHLSRYPASVREAKLGQLSREIPQAREAFAVLSRLWTIPGARMGIDVDSSRPAAGDRGPVELWLRLDPKAFPLDARDPDPAP